MNQENAIECSTYSEIEELMAFITECYNNGIYVHFINRNHRNINCYAIEKTQIIYIPSELRQAAKIIINAYNEHFCMNENDDDDDDNNENDDKDNEHFCMNEDDDDDDDDNNENDDDEHEQYDEKQNEENYIDSNIAFTCPACNILSL